MRNSGAILAGGEEHGADVTDGNGAVVELARLVADGGIHDDDPWGTAGVPLAASRAASFDAWGVSSILGKLPPWRFSIALNPITCSCKGEQPRLHNFS